MLALKLKNYRTYFIIGLIAIFSLFALWLRLIPMLNMGNTDILTMVGSDDPLYNLRQVEQLLTNFPIYTWYDPMTLYPLGTTIYWGPLFIYISAFACMITGATTRPEIIGTCLLIPPIMATITVVLMYFVGKVCGDWKTGLLASGFTAIVSGQFFYRSFYGYFDHHIGEVLFSTLFCLLYIYAILSEKGKTIDLKKFDSYKTTFIFSCFAGIAYLLGLFLMPTMILFAMIVGIFTIIQSFIDFYRNKSTEYLLIINGVCFSIAIIGLFIFGFKNSNSAIDLSTYSLGHIYAYLIIIGGTGALYLLARYLKGREKYYYPATLLGLLIVAVGILFVAFPQLFNLFIVDLFQFFGQQPITNTVQEARGWSTDLAWAAFNYGLILFVGGALVMVYNNFKDEHPHQVFALVWSVVMFYSTWQHIRYEYYTAINVALLSAVCIYFLLDLSLADLTRLVKGIAAESSSNDKETTKKDETPKGKKQKKSHKKAISSTSFNFLNLGLLIIALGIAILFIYTSVNYSYINATNNPIRMNGDWRESLEWMGNNTPDTGVNYFTIYDKKTFQYPNSSYGVMSWWDYGHMITYIAKRIPNANPFQQGVAGPNGSAAYFMAESENTANNIADNIGIRYVITDIEMDEAINGKFWAMATWYNSTLGASPYWTTYGAPSRDNPNQLVPIPLINQHYYDTMVSRLHNFDGSLTNATSVYYVEYVDPSISSVNYPIITRADAMNASDAQLKAEQYNEKAQQGYHAAVLSPAISLPVDNIPALSHYRLVHESPSNVYGAKIPDIKYVKVFEYVKGAHIKGNGVIEIPLVSNTGRQFTYRQQSINGEFIVPYSTSDNPYTVKAVGKYKIVGSYQEFDVPENAIMQGLSIN